MRNPSDFSCDNGPSRMRYKLSHPTERVASGPARVGVNGCPKPRLATLYPCIRCHIQ